MSTKLVADLAGANIEESLEAQRKALWEVQAAVETVAYALERHFGVNAWPANVPGFHMVLERAAAGIGEVAGRLEEIAQEAKVMNDNITPIRPDVETPVQGESKPARLRPMTDSDNEAMLVIGHARAIADTIYNGTAHLDSSFIEELGNSSLNALACVLIEKLDHARKLIEQPYDD